MNEKQQQTKQAKTPYHTVETNCIATATMNTNNNIGEKKSLKKLSLVFMVSVTAAAAMLLVLLWLSKRLAVSEYG